MAAGAVSGGHCWRTLHTLGRGASGAVVSLAADAASGELFAVKSAPPHASAAVASLRRERAVLSGLSSPHVVRCVGAAEAADGPSSSCSYHLFLEYAPGGSLADAAARNGGSLGERAAGAYAADVARGLAYLHARSVVHGDVKPRNVVIGADGRAKLADFGCARAVASAPARAAAIGGTPAFMAPEAARGEGQGPPADVWALGCTVVEMVTGRAPWGGDADGGDVLAALHRIGYTDAVPKAPSWLSAEARDFLACCLARDAADRWTAAELLEHPFVVASAGAAADEKAPRWVSPKSTLDAAFWESEESDSDEACDEGAAAAERIKSLACAASAFPDWDREEGCWIDVLGEQRGEVQVASGAPSKVSGAEAVPAGGLAVGGGVVSDDELETEDVPFAGDAPAAADDASVGRQSKRCLGLSSGCRILQPKPELKLLCCDGVTDEIKLWFPKKFAVLLCLIFLVRTMLTPNCSSTKICLLPHSTVNTRACNGRLLGCNGIKGFSQFFWLLLCSVSFHSHFTLCFRLIRCVSHPV